MGPGPSTKAVAGLINGMTVWKAVEYVPSHAYIPGVISGSGEHNLQA